MLEASVDFAPRPQDSQFGLVVVTQDCDLLREPDIEPFVELVFCRKIEAAQPLYRNGRNPRLLHIPLREPGRCLTWLQISIHDRLRIGKEVLADVSTCDAARLEDEEVRLLRRWIARRYTRAAFPDAFNRRLEKVGDRLERLFKSRDGQVVTGLYLDIDDTEYDPETPYDIAVLVTAAVGTWADKENRLMLQGFEEQLFRILNDCEGIALSAIYIYIADTGR